SRHGEEQTAEAHRVENLERAADLVEVPDVRVPRRPVEEPADDESDDSADGDPETTHADRVGRRGSELPTLQLPAGVAAQALPELHEPDREDDGGRDLEDGRAPGLPEEPGEEGPRRAAPAPHAEGERDRGPGEARVGQGVDEGDEA